MSKFDVCIIGGGHAGCEAAYISSQYNLRVGIITLLEVPLASTPCNPAVGGVGKGQVVREVDSLGGLISQIADRAGIQYRILNESKGYAVQSTRAQVDKDLYAQIAEELIAEVDNIEVIREKVSRVEKLDEIFVIETDKQKIQAKKVIVTTGTFLNGKLHCGTEQVEGGRVDCQKSDGLTDIFSEVRVLTTRFKTGTPPRLRLSSIDFSNMVTQPSDERAINFHWNNRNTGRIAKQIDCHLTRTSEKTMGIIRDNKESSPMYNGQIQGVGPRYCPSIEDKAFRYPDRNSHHVFVEPEGHTCETVYPNGVSTSLPKEIQLDFIRTIEGFENAEIVIPGYAVEYDVVDTTQLTLGLESKAVKGLYFAGQVNGTSGYEEAAGQGLIAGINASRSLRNEPLFVLSRDESYIGVMVEDLVKNERDEPYRLFTARSENRLYIREDNVLVRMSSYRRELGLNTALDSYYDSFEEEYFLLKELLEDSMIIATKENKEHFEKEGYGNLPQNISYEDLLKRSQVDPVSALETELSRIGACFSKNVIKTLAIEFKYRGYIQRSDREMSKTNKVNNLKISWEKLIENTNISNECRQRIEKIQPETFGQLSRIVGIRPATLAVVAGSL
ncbi:MAG: tRNA uridine-5-carboxymethylaminomethyl(34) synthesis enzyme MnmG [Oligoflexia bacterium]|nr:tRNA uridine-5-carboxymethylaminomethyl(34) synthesis enzyme MnmG [Oligoflexia bacterium]